VCFLSILFYGRLGIQSTPKTLAQSLPQGNDVSATADALAQATDVHVVINELQYHPASDDHREEYIELYNAGANVVDLTGWRFSDGVAYTIPTGTLLLPDAYLVIAHDVGTVEHIYGITEVLGPFERGRLSNSGERLTLENANGTLMDEVLYDDHLPWPELADGDGPSLELINPTFDNTRPCSWSSSHDIGSPGTRNDVYVEGNIPPCITDVTYTPSLPQTNQPISVTAVIDDNRADASSTPPISATLYYRPHGESQYRTLTMSDDGLDGDIYAGDTVYTALIPPRSISGTMYIQPGAGTYIEFYIRAMDNEGAARIMPEGAPGHASAETGSYVTTSYLVWVEDTPPTSPLPLYRLILTDENRYELQTRDLFSNVHLDATFVYSNEVFSNVGIRYRGESTRDAYPSPYRVKFRDAQEFEGRERVNLVSDSLGREALTHDLFQRAGLPAPDTRFVTLYINGEWEGDYLDVEQVDRDFLKAHAGEWTALGDDNDGNLYRGWDGANLKYRGPDADAYRLYYIKKTNEDEDDYTDIISLTHALDLSPDETFLAASQSVADMRQWLKWFAIQAVVDNREGALWKGQGDDYFLYHRGFDDRFILISWDHDSTFRNPYDTIWVPDTSSTGIVRRILHYPLFTRWYYQGIIEVAQGPFSSEEMLPRIAALPDVVDEEERQALRDFVTMRLPNLWTEIPQTRLRILTNAGEDIITTQEEVILEGECSPLRDVTINGDAAGVIYPTPTSWRYTAKLWTRDNVFHIADGQDTLMLTVFRDLFHGGVIHQDTVLETSELPYTIYEDITLSGEVTLTIKPGVTFYFDPRRVIRVEQGARLLAEGTAEHPIIFTIRESFRDWEENFWGGILFYDTRADNRIHHAVLEYIQGVIENPRSDGVTGYASNFTIADSILRHMRRSNAVTANTDSRLVLLRNDIYDIGSDAVHPTGGYAHIQGNLIHDTFYDPSYNPAPPEGIELSSMETPAVVLDNQIYNITDDCLDLNRSSARIERNILHHCGDKGISIGYPSSTTLVNNLIYACWGNDDDPLHTGFGIALKDGATSHIMNNTLVDNRHGLGLFEMHNGAGGGTATVVNSIIWDNGTNLAVRDDSTITVDYSHIQGGWPGASNFFDQAPLFRSAQNRNYRLQETSPCIDTGTSEGAPTLDVLGISRPHGKGVDRGAYEFFEFYAVYIPLILDHP
jgi:hypothetical protein